MPVGPDGGPRTPTNLELVEEFVALATKMGRDIATPAQAAAIMPLPNYPAPFTKAA